MDFCARIDCDIYILFIQDCLFLIIQYVCWFKLEGDSIA